MATLSISSMSTLTGSSNNNTCVMPIVDLNTPSTSNQNKKSRITTHNLFFTNNTSVNNLSSYANYFGTGADGDCTISSSAQISSSTSPAGLNNNLYGDVIIKNFKNLTVNSGIFYSPLRACRGMIIYCTGNLTINGTISMTGKGGGVGNKIASPIGIASSTDARFDLVDATLYFNNFSSSALGGRGIPTHWNWAPSGSVWFNNYKIRIPLSGSVAGGTGGPSANSGGGSGTAGVFCCGGGGGGGAGQNNYSQFGAGGVGGRGTIFSGGGGGGGGGASNNYAVGGSGLFESGGNGGSGNTGKGGGGAGSPAGTNTPGSGNGQSGVGGTVVFIVRGNFTNNGTISSNGFNGGAGNQAPFGPQAGGGGGGSGGGCILIIYGGTYTNTGTIVANGGSGGANGPGGGGTGGSGGAGSIRSKKVQI